MVVVVVATVELVVADVVVVVVGPVPIVVVVVDGAVVVELDGAVVVELDGAVVVELDGAVVVELDGAVVVELDGVVELVVVVVVVVVVVGVSHMVVQEAEPDGPASQSSAKPSAFGDCFLVSPQKVSVQGPLLPAGLELLVHKLSAVSPPRSHSSSPSTLPSPQTGPASTLKDSPTDKNRGNSKDRCLRFDMVMLLELVIYMLTFVIVDNFLRQFSYSVPVKSIFNHKLTAIRLDPGKYAALTAGPAGILTLRRVRAVLRAAMLIA